MIEALERLPRVSPAAGFEDRVMARWRATAPVAVPVRPPVPARYGRRLWATVAGAGATSLAGTVGTLVWAFGHQQQMVVTAQQGWTVALDTVRTVALEAQTVVTSSVGQVASEWVLDHGPALLAGSATVMSLYIIGCAALVRLLRAPRAVYAS